jgi:RND family efflux transporter MFP subunit
MWRWLAATLALVACAACGDDRVPPPIPHDAHVMHVTTQTVDAEVSQGFVGVITAAESVDIAPRFQGVVASVAVRPGDTVTTGQVVAEMDRKSMEEELRAAEATLGAAVAAQRQANVDVEDSRRKVKVETKAVADGISARVTLDEAQFALKRAYAASQKAASSVGEESSHVQTARDHLADLALRAPTDGTVAMRFKDPGATVAAGTAVVRIVGHGGVRLRFAVPPDHAQKLAPGNVVHATVDTISKPIAATISQVSPALDPSSGMIIVEAELGSDATTTELRPGLAAWVK